MLNNLLNNFSNNLFAQVSLVKEFVENANSKALLVNFTSTAIDDARHYYSRYKAVINKVNINHMTDEQVEDLEKALDGEIGTYDNTVVLLYRANNRRPVEVCNIKPLQTEENLRTLKTRFGKIDLAARNFQADLTDALVKAFEEELEKEKALLKVAAVKLEKKKLEHKIYHTERFEMDSYELKRFDENGYMFEKKTLVHNSSDFFRALHKKFGLTPKEAVKIATYCTNEVFQVTFDQEIFPEAPDFPELFRINGGIYQNSSALRHIRKDGVFNTVQTKDVFVNIENGETLEDVEKLQRFLNIAHGASGSRKNSVLFIVDDARAEETLALSSRGAYTGLKGKRVSRKNTVKANVRVHNGFAPSAILTEADCIGIYNGEFGKGERKAVEPFNILPPRSITEFEEIASLVEEYKKLKGTLDGTAYHYFDMLQDFQGRIATSKCFATFTGRNYIKTLIETLDKAPLILEIGKSDEEDAKAQKIIDMVFSNDDTYKERVILVRKYGSRETVPQYFSDKNGYKASFDVKNCFEVPVLAFPKPKRANTSQQAFVKAILAGGDKAVEWLYNHLKNACEKVIGEFYTPTTLTLKDINDMYFAGSVGVACPEYMRLDSSVKRTKVTLMLNEIAKILNDCKAPIKNSMNCRAISDAAANFGCTLLAENEAFVPGAPHGVQGITFKYPSIEGGEFAKVMIIGLKEINRRINALNAPDAIKQALKEFYALRTPGTAVMPASKALMRGLAGYDFDFDMVMIIWDEAFTSLFDNVTQSVCHIKPGTPNHIDDGIYGIDMMYKPCIDMLGKKTDDVGSVTVNYDTVAQFLATVKTKRDRMPEQKRLAFEGGSCRFLETLLDYSLLDAKKPETVNRKKNLATLEVAPVTVFDGKQIVFKDLGQKQLPSLNNVRNRRYKGLPEYRTNLYTILPMGQKEEAQLLEELSSCRVDSFDTFEKMIRDIIRMARSHQETTIDAPKTSIFANIFLNISMFFGAYSRVNYEYKIQRDEKTEEFFIQRRVKSGTRYDKLSKKYYFYDIFAELRDKLEAIVIPQVQKILAENNDFEALKTKVNAFRRFKLEHVKPLYDLAAIYGSMASYTAQNVINDNDKAFITKAYRLINGNFNYFMQNSNDDNMNKILNNPVKLGEFVTQISLTNLQIEKEGYKINWKPIKSAFNNICFPDVTVRFAMDITDTRPIIAEPVEALSSAMNQWCYFIDGIAYDANDEMIAVAKEFINGDFHLQEMNDMSYAIADINSDLAYKAPVIENKQVIIMVEHDALKHGITKGINFVMPKVAGKKALTINDTTYTCHMRYNVNAFSGKEVVVSDVLTIPVTHTETTPYGEEMETYTSKICLICDIIGEAINEIEADPEEFYVPSFEDVNSEIFEYTPEEDGFAWEDIPYDESLLDDEDIF